MRNFFSVLVGVLLCLVLFYFVGKVKSSTSESVKVELTETDGTLTEGQEETAIAGWTSEPIGSTASRDRDNRRTSSATAQGQDEQVVVLTPISVPSSQAQTGGKKTTTTATNRDDATTTAVNQWGASLDQFLADNAEWTSHWKIRLSRVEKNAEKIGQEFFETSWRNGQLYSWEVFNTIRYRVNGFPEAVDIVVANPAYKPGNGEPAYVDGMAFDAEGRRIKLRPSIKESVEATQAATRPRH